MEQQENLNIVLLLILGTCGMLVMSVFIIAFIVNYQRKMANQQNHMQEMQLAYQRELLEVAIEIQENERRRIAKDLHDEIGAMLSTMRLSLIQVSRNVPANSQSADYTQQAKNLLDETINNVRRISKDLLPATLDEFGLVDALEELCDKVRASAIMEVDFTCEATFRRVDPKVELTLYRIAQELINNSLKHANANRIEIALAKTESQLVLTISDDGDGFDHEEVSQRRGKGLGLKNIESRASAINASIQYNGVEKKGTHIVIEVALAS